MSPISMILLAALYYIGKHRIPGIHRYKISDVVLWISALVLLVFGLWAVWGRIQDLIG
ncbi:MAG: hypothetical protein AB3N14_02975 [Flavobacteriaceae bacterium]